MPNLNDMATMRTTTIRFCCIIALIFSFSWSKYVVLVWTVVGCGPNGTLGGGTQIVVVSFLLSMDWIDNNSNTQQHV